MLEQLSCVLFYYTGDQFLSTGSALFLYLCYSLFVSLLLLQTQIFPHDQFFPFELSTHLCLLTLAKEEAHCFKNLELWKSWNGNKDSNIPFLLHHSHPHQSSFNFYTKIFTSSFKYEVFLNKLPTYGLACVMYFSLYF